MMTTEPMTHTSNTSVVDAALQAWFGGRHIGLQPGDPAYEEAKVSMSAALEAAAFVAPFLPPDIAKLIEAYDKAERAHADAVSDTSIIETGWICADALAALNRAIASHTEPGLRRSLEIVDRQIQAYVTPNSDYSHGVMDMAKAFSKAIRAELDKLGDDPIPEEWKSTPPATPDRAEADPIRKALRGALAWGCVYGPVIAHKDWNDMREIMVEQFSAEIATPSGNHPVGVEETDGPKVYLNNRWVTLSGLSLELMNAMTEQEMIEVRAAFERGYQGGLRFGIGVCDEHGATVPHVKARIAANIATRPAPSVPTVTDDMIERAYLAYDRAVIDRMRHALEAALVAQAAPGGEDIS